VKSIFNTLIGASLLFAANAHAGGEGPDLSFGQLAPYQKVTDSVDNLSIWADGEYVEHEGEGLFKRYPEDGLVIRTTLALANELKQQAAQTKDAHKARALLFAAEATALYAAKMPHLLEARIAQQQTASHH